MYDTTPKILPRSGSPTRPGWLVDCSEAVASSVQTEDSSVTWPEKVTKACDEVLAMIAKAPNSRFAIPGPNAAKRLASLSRRSGNAALKTAMPAELLGTMVRKIPTSTRHTDLCRTAYPALWDLALDDLAADPDTPRMPDPVLYDHSIPVASVYDSGPPWPEGIDEARHTVTQFAHSHGTYSPHGLGIPHCAPGLVLRPPVTSPIGLTKARDALTNALGSTLVRLEEHSDKLVAYLVARDNPDLPDPTVSERDQIAAANRDWCETVLPAAIDLATTTYANAWEWASSDTDKWDPEVAVYSHTEACLSIHSLRRVADVLEMSDVAARSHAWWWCHERNLDTAALRDAARAW